MGVHDDGDGVVVGVAVEVDAVRMVHDDGAGDGHGWGTVQWVLVVQVERVRPKADCSLLLPPSLTSHSPWP